MPPQYTLFETSTGMAVSDKLIKLQPNSLAMAHPHQRIIENFYEAFANHDAETMAAQYHPRVEFCDPAFGRLYGEDAANMWRMLIGRGKDNLLISYEGVKADEQTGSARWTADYLFSASRRAVHNEITATFEFQDGKIIRHTDVFDFWRWSRQALGPAGWLLGWTPLLRNKVRAQAVKGLERYKNQV